MIVLTCPVAIAHHVRDRRLQPRSTLPLCFGSFATHIDTQDLGDNITRRADLVPDIDQNVCSVE